jgi:hypothetical protein
MRRWADNVRHFFTKLADSAALFQAERLQSADDGLLIVFDESSDTPFLQHDSRAQKLLHSLATACSSMQVYMTERLVSVMDRLDFNFSFMVH